MKIETHLTIIDLNCKSPEPCSTLNIDLLIRSVVGTVK